MQAETAPTCFYRCSCKSEVRPVISGTEYGYPLAQKGESKAEEAAQMASKNVRS
jgi:hypothetical protein